MTLNSNVTTLRGWIARRPLLSFCLVSAAWVGVLYSGVLSAPFVYDDLDQIVNNPALNSWHMVYTRFLLAPVTFTSGFLGSGGTTYRPIFWVSLALDQHLWGAEAGGFHATSLLLHWINGVLLFGLLRRLRLSATVAGLTALVWLGLPIHSEAVAWVSARAYLLSTAFLLAGLHAALSFVRTKSWVWLGLFGGAALLADYSHEQGVLLVALLGLAYLVEVKGEQKPWIVLGSMALVADAVYGISKVAVGAHGGDGPRTVWAFGLEFWQYVQLIVAPVHMSLERSSAVPANAPSMMALAAWAALIGLGVAGFLVRRRAPVVAAGVAVLLIGLLPYCGLVYVYQGMAERFLYLAAIGLVLAVVSGVMLAGPVPRRVLLGCVAVWVAWGAWRLVVRVEDWQQPLALYRNSLETTPNSATLRKNLADVYVDQGNFQEAVAEYQRSLSFTPDDPKTVLNYAAALQQTGDKRTAEEQYRRVTKLTPRASAAYVDLESLYIEEGRLDDAIAMYQQAVAVDPNDVNAYFDLGVMFQQRGQDREALAFYKKVLQLKPGDQETLLYVSKLHAPSP